MSDPTAEADYIIDTNVLLVASARDPLSRFKNCDHVPVEHQQLVFEWLVAFRRDTNRYLVLDETFRIWKEYHHNLVRGQDLGAMVVAEKLQSSLVRLRDIEFDGAGDGRLPLGLERLIHDRSDRKFVAVAYRDLCLGGKSTIINAVDSDWCKWEKDLSAAGIAVRHLIEELCDDEAGDLRRGRPKSGSKGRGRRKR